MYQRMKLDDVSASEPKRVQQNLWVFNGRKLLASQVVVHPLGKSLSTGAVFGVLNHAVRRRRKHTTSRYITHNQTVVATPFSALGSSCPCPRACLQKPWWRVCLMCAVWLYLHCTLPTYGFATCSSLRYMSQTANEPRLVALGFFLPPHH